MQEKKIKISQKVKQFKHKSDIKNFEWFYFLCLFVQKQNQK